jgi:hypothetical protein
MQVKGERETNRVARRKKGRQALCITNLMFLASKEAFFSILVMALDV